MTRPAPCICPQGIETIQGFAPRTAHPPPSAPLPRLAAQAEADQRERVRQALLDAEAELAAAEGEEEDPYWVPFDDCPGAGEHCAACWGCPEARVFTRLR